MKGWKDEGIGDLEKNEKDGKRDWKDSWEWPSEGWETRFLRATFLNSRQSSPRDRFQITNTAIYHSER